MSRSDDRVSVPTNGHHAPMTAADLRVPAASSAPATAEATPGTTPRTTTKPKTKAKKSKPNAGSKPKAGSKAQPGPAPVAAAAPATRDRSLPPGEIAGTDLRIAFSPGQVAAGFGIIAGLILLVLGRRRGRR